MKKVSVPRTLSRDEKRVLSKQLLHSWHMFVWSAATAHTELPDKGAPYQQRAMYGTTTAVFMRRLLSFYFPSPRAHPDEVHAARFVLGWSAVRPPKLVEASNYVSQYIVHITEAHLTCGDKMPIPPAGEWLAALAPFHNKWLHAVDPKDLDVTWNANMRCFEAVAQSQGVRADGGSDYEHVVMSFRFKTLGGIEEVDPPAFLAPLVKRPSLVALPGQLVWLPPTTK